MDVHIIITLAAITICILLSGFFSGSETGLTAISQAKLQTLIKKGNKRALLVKRLRGKKEHLIGAILIGNNTVNIAASALATGLALELFPDHGVLYATIVMTLLVLIFAEVLPKTYAVHRAESFSLAVGPLIYPWVWLLTPVTKILQQFVSILIRLLGKNAQDGEMSASDVLRGAIELQHEQGSVEKGNRDMLGSILDLAETELSDVMVHRKNMITINSHLPSKTIIEKALSHHVTRIPLWKDKPDNIIAILHIRTLLEAIRTHPDEDIDIMSIAVKPWFIPETTSLDQQLKQFREKRQHMALVVDEYGDLAGLVTLEDILEEIVGQIEDEIDVQASPDIRPLKNNTVWLRGDATIRDINRRLDWNLPDDLASTIAGLIIHHAERIPEEKESFQLHEHRFTVLKKEANQITEIEAVKAKDNGVEV